MKTCQKIQLIITLIGLTLVGNSYADGDAAAGQSKAAVCAACHGADGNSVNSAWPKLAGQNEKYIVKQLKAYKAGAKGGRTGASATQMYGMAAGLSEQDMADIAAYYASQETKIGLADDALAERGQLIYRGGIADYQIASCTGCHGPSGKGNSEAAYPSLAGQHAEYTYAQLKAFHSGARNNDPNSMMRALIPKMSDADMKAVSEYIQGLH